MSRRWTERELRTLTSIAAPGVSAKEISARYNATLGCRKRTDQAVLNMLVERKIRYGNRHYLAWENDETRLLLSMAGRATVWEIQHALRDECGSERTIVAVRTRLHHVHDLSCWPDRDARMRSGDVARLLGMSTSGVIRRIIVGELEAIEHGTPRCRRWYVTPDQVERFVDANVLVFEPERMAPGPLRQRVELARRQGRYLTTEQASEITGVHRQTVTTACRLGELPATRARTMSRNGTPRWQIKASDLARWHAHIPMKVAS